MPAHQDEFDIMMERISKNKDIERGLQHVATTNNQCDPVVRQMATAVLHEVDRAKRRRATNNCIGCIGLIVVVIVFIVLTVTGSWGKGRRHRLKEELNAV